MGQNLAGAPAARRKQMRACCAEEMRACCARRYPGYDRPEVRRHVGPERGDDGQVPHHRRGPDPAGTCHGRLGHVEGHRPAAGDRPVGRRRLGTEGHGNHGEHRGPARGLRARVPDGERADPVREGPRRGLRGARRHHQGSCPAEGVVEEEQRRHPLLRREAVHHPARAQGPGARDQGRAVRRARADQDGRQLHTGRADRGPHRPAGRLPPARGCRVACHHAGLHRLDNGRRHHDPRPGRLRLHGHDHRRGAQGRGGPDLDRRHGHHDLRPPHRAGRAHHLRRSATGRRRSSPTSVPRSSIPRRSSPP